MRFYDLSHNVSYIRVYLVEASQPARKQEPRRMPKSQTDFNIQHTLPAVTHHAILYSPGSPRDGSISGSAGAVLGGSSVSWTIHWSMDWSLDKETDEVRQFSSRD